MGRSRFLRSHHWLAPLLVLAFSVGPAVALTPEEAAWRAARTAIDRLDFTLADHLITEALKRSADKNGRWYWELRVLRGRLAMWTGKYADVLTWLDADLPSSLRNSATDAKRSAYLGLAHARLRDGVDPAPFFAKAKAIAARHPGVTGEVYVLSSNAATTPERVEADARKALESAAAYREFFWQMMAMNDIGFGCRMQERYAEAIHWLEATQALARQHGVEWVVQKAEGNLGWTYMALGDFETAAGLFETAQKTAARLGRQRDHVTWTNQRGNAALHMRDYQTARRFCAEAVALSEGVPGAAAERAYALANLARVALEERELELAEKHNDAALEVKKARNDKEGVQRSLILAAEIAAVRGRHDEAIAAFKDIAAKAEKLPVRWEAQGRLAQALLLANRHRDAEAQFREAIRTVREAREDITDVGLRIAFFRMAEDIFDAYVDFLVGQKREQAALEVTELIRAATLEEELGLGAPKPLDLAALARARQATILCYWLGGEKSYVWVITPAGATLKELRRERDIESRVDAYQRLILNPRVSLAQLSARGEELYRMLVEPAAIRPQSRVVVVPDGRLHVLNMESLVVPGAKPRFWIEDVTLVNAASLQLLARKARAAAATSQRMLLVGNPPPADAAYPPLRKAKTEMDHVRRHFPKPVVLDGANATPAAYEAATPGAFEYLHFVAHGEATRRKPLDAAVILGRGRDGNYKLFARDILRHSLTARLVTVSSCHGAGTRPFVGEGLVGLTWAFLSAGAQQVIAALWEVSDDAAPALMDALYARIRRGQDPATALREAKLEFVAKSPRPFYWAPFVLYGG
jgi:CHAT domain-containing protein